METSPHYYPLFGKPMDAPYKGPVKGYLSLAAPEVDIETIPVQPIMKKYIKRTFRFQY